MFADRDDAARQLAKCFEDRDFKEPLVLGIPRGGVIVGKAIAEQLGAEFDVILSRRLRAPWNPDHTIGAVCEDKKYLLSENSESSAGLSDEYLREEIQHQLNEINRYRSILRRIRPAARGTNRSVIIADDGVASGATMISAMQAVRTQEPFEIVVAIPIVAVDKIDRFRRWCDEVVCLSSPSVVGSIQQYYRSFPSIDDARLCDLVAESLKTHDSTKASRRHGPVQPPIGVLSDRDWVED